MRRGGALRLEAATGAVHCRHRSQSSAPTHRPCSRAWQWRRLPRGPRTGLRTGVRCSPSSAGRRCRSTRPPSPPAWRFLRRPRRNASARRSSRSRLQSSPQPVSRWPSASAPTTAAPRRRRRPRPRPARLGRRRPRARSSRLPPRRRRRRARRRRRPPPPQRRRLLPRHDDPPIDHHGSGNDGCAAANDHRGHDHVHRHDDDGHHSHRHDGATTAPRRRGGHGDRPARVGSRA